MDARISNRAWAGLTAGGTPRSILFVFPGMVKRTPSAHVVGPCFTGGSWYSLSAWEVFACKSFAPHFRFFTSSTDIQIDNRTCASSIYTSTYRQMNPEFGIYTLVGTLGLSTFVLGCRSGTGKSTLRPMLTKSYASGVRTSVDESFERVLR